MSIQANDINPIRFYNTANTIDWDDYFPNDYNMAMRTEYFEGEYPQDFYPFYLVDNEIQIQFWISDLLDLTMTVHLPSGTTSTITPTNINPSGWTSTDVFLYTYTPTTNGVYYFTIDDFVSDSFYVVNETKFKKRMIKLEYSNTENDFNTVFYNSTTQVFTPHTYVQGILRGGPPRNDMAVFESDRGVVSKQRSTPMSVSVLQFITHRLLRDHINLIFACDTIEVNGVSYQTMEAPEFEPTEKEDLFNVTVTLIDTNYNYYRKII